MGHLDHLVMISMPDSAAAESFRMLRTSLLRFIEQGVRRILFVSPWGGDGKSMVCANLAVALAQSEKQVVVVDGDLRRPTLSTLFACSTGEGLSNALQSGQSAVPLLHTTEVPRVRVLPAGPFLGRPPDLMTTPRMGAVLDEVAAVADCVVIDTAPMTFFSEGRVLAALSDGVVLVINPKHFRGREEQDLKRSLGECGARILGLILNAAETSASTGYQGSYYGYRNGSNRKR
ncbi:MAG: tyrosine-protein kinase family protein [Candidatus Xenobia bacterium]